MFKRKIFIKNEEETIKEFEKRIQKFLDSTKNLEEERINTIINNNTIIIHYSFYTPKPEKKIGF